MISRKIAHLFDVPRSTVYECGHLEQTKIVPPQPKTVEVRDLTATWRLASGVWRLSQDCGTGAGVHAPALPLRRSTGIHSWESVSAPISTGCVRRSSGPVRLVYGFEGNHCVNTSRHSSCRALG